jgi:hypothetical protein
MKLNCREQVKSGWNMTTWIVAAAAAISMLAANLQANASTIAGWDFNGVSGYGASPLAPNSSDSHVTVVGLTRGSGVTTSGTAGNNAWGGNGWDGSTTAAQAIAAGDFGTFTVKANAGFSLALSSIDPYNVRHSGTGPATGQWQYSLDGTNFTDIGSPITWGANTTATGNAQVAINLSATSGLQSISGATVATFRVANYNATGATGTWYFQDPSASAGTDFSLSGNAVPIPEPSTFVLATVFGLTLVSLRRRVG